MNVHLKCGQMMTSYFFYHHNKVQKFTFLLKCKDMENGNKNYYLLHILFRRPS